MAFADAARHAGEHLRVRESRGGRAARRVPRPRAFRLARSGRPGDHPRRCAADQPREVPRRKTLIRFLFPPTLLPWKEANVRPDHMTMLDAMFGLAGFTS